MFGPRKDKVGVGLGGRIPRADGTVLVPSKAASAAVDDLEVRTVDGLMDRGVVRYSCVEIGLDVSTNNSISVCINILRS